MANASFNQIYALDDNYLYVARASSVGGTSVNYIGRWDGGANSISTISGGVNDISVSVIVGPDNNSIFLGGNFTQAGEESANRVAYFNGTSWRSLGNPPFTSDVSGLKYDFENNLLYAGSHGTTTTSDRLCVWDGESWTSLSDSFVINSYPKLALDSNGNLYLGYAASLRRYLRESSTWEILSGNVGASINDLEYNHSENRVYIACATSNANNVKYYDIEGGTVENFGTAPGSLYDIAFNSDGILHVSTWPSSGYTGSVAKYEDGSFVDLYNYQSTSGVLSLIIDGNDTVFCQANSGGLTVGRHPYTEGNWGPFNSSTTLELGGASQPKPSPSPAQNPIFDPIVFKNKRRSLRMIFFPKIGFRR